MMVEMSSSVTSSRPVERRRRRDRGLIGAVRPEQQRRRRCRAWRPLSAISARSASWIITFGAASPTMNCSSGTVRRVFSGRKIAPCRPQANCTSSVSVVFSASTATRSPRADLEPVAQMRGEARNPRVELRVGEAAFAGEIDDRQLVRRPAAEMRDPVIVPNRQDFLHRPQSLPPYPLIGLYLYAACPTPAQLASRSCMHTGGWLGGCLALSGWRMVPRDLVSRMDVQRRVSAPGYGIRLRTRAGQAEDAIHVNP